MITTKQRSYLKSLAHNLQPLFQIGKGNISENMILQYEEAFETHELIKTSVLNNSLLDTKEACEKIAKTINAEVVLVIGNKFVLYKENKKEKYREKKLKLPRK
jgi:RNA-binding protein